MESDGSRKTRHGRTSVRKECDWIVCVRCVCVRVCVAACMCQTPGSAPGESSSAVHVLPPQTQRVHTQSRQPTVARQRTCASRADLRAASGDVHVADSLPTGGVGACGGVVISLLGGAAMLAIGCW